MRSLYVTGRTAGVPVACPGTVTVTPFSGLASLNRQTSAYFPEPKSMLIGLTVPGPVFSISAYTALLAGSTRSISAPPVPWLLIWIVCQPGPGTDQVPPHWLPLTSMTPGCWAPAAPGPPELQAVSAAKNAVSTAPAAAQIEDARAWPPWRRSPRRRRGWCRWCFGPADFMASIGMRSLTVGGQPAGYDFDAHHYPLMRMLVAARANGLQAIDGPYARIQDTEGLRKASAGVAALGYDGKWVLHPAQVPVVNEAFTPAAEEYWRALAILAAYDRATSLDRRGAVMLGDEMIDEASRKMALMLAAKGAAAGLPGPPRPPEPAA